MVGRLNTNNTQLLHPFRLQKHNSDKPLDDSYQREKLQRDKNIVVLQDNLYAIACETTFDPLLNPKIG